MDPERYHKLRVHFSGISVRVKWCYLLLVSKNIIPKQYILAQKTTNKPFLNPCVQKSQVAQYRPFLDPIPGPVLYVADSRLINTKDISSISETLLMGTTVQPSRAFDN